MKENKTTILGISPNTRSMGMAVVKENLLLDWEVHTFKGKWTLKKLGIILHDISTSIEYYQVTVLTIRLPAISSRSKNFLRLLAEIIRLAKQYEIEVYTYSLEDLREYFSKDPGVNRKMLMASISNNIFELTMLSKKIQKCSNDYHFKIFEAVGVATMYSKGIKPVLV